jgi:hypothetical protein
MAAIKNTPQMWQFAILWHPNEEEAKAGKRSTVLVDLKTVLAPDQQGATILAAREIPADNLTALDQVEIVLRPF